MSKKFGICCVNCRKPLNNEDDIFGTSCGHLYHFPCIRSNHGKSTTCMHCEAYKPMMFKMNLTFDDLPVTSKFQELCNKLNDHEKINTLLISSNTAARQTILQHEAEIETLKDALQAKEVTVKELNDRIETMEAFSQYLSINRADNFTRKQQPTNNNNYGFKNQIWCDENNTKKVESLSSKHRNQNQNNDYNQNQQEVVANASNNRQQQQDSLDETRRNTVVIRNFKSSDLSKDNALANVIGLAEQMRLTLTPDHIKDICVLSEDQNFLTYLVYFCTKHMKEQFLRNIHMLKQLPDTKFLTIF
ncbi:hypothetical protein DOY81_013961 [Sarcophaga bullata]|nr:hypothetical protein DOY81_013961 [Sarcophaga bullata]